MQRFCGTVARLRALGVRSVRNGKEFWRHLDSLSQVIMI